MAGLSTDRPSEVVLAARVARQFYIEGVSKVDAAEAMRLASHKLGLRTKFVAREGVH